jgi:hypothetical protein
MVVGFAVTPGWALVARAYDANRPSLLRPAR